MTALRTLRRAHDRLVICAETSEDWALVREMDAAIEQVAVMQASADVSLAELIASTSIYTGRMPHPVCQEELDEDDESWRASNFPTISPSVCTKETR